MGDEASKLAWSPFCPVGVGGTIFQHHMQRRSSTSIATACDHEDKTL